MDSPSLITDDPILGRRAESQSLIRSLEIPISSLRLPAEAREARFPNVSLPL